MNTITMQVFQNIRMLRTSSTVESRNTLTLLALQLLAVFVQSLHVVVVESPSFFLIGVFIICLDNGVCFIPNAL